MNAILQSWNDLEPGAAAAALIQCCAAHRWAAAVAASRPFAEEESLHDAADTVWNTMQEADWLEAFRAHPRIGERKAAPVHAGAQSTAWSRGEQAAVTTAEADVLTKLAAGNTLYEASFGFTYIVCATGKSAEEMLRILDRRLASDRQTELREAAEQQRQIMHIRLRKWLHA